LGDGIGWGGGGVCGINPPIRNTSTAIAIIIKIMVFKGKFCVLFIILNINFL
jgi:hypothetical protein